MHQCSGAFCAARDTKGDGVRKMTLVAALLAATLTASSCKPSATPTPTATPNPHSTITVSIKQLAQALDVDAATSPLAEGVTPLPVWNGNANDFVEALSNPLQDMATIPMEEGQKKVAAIPLGYTMAFVSGKEKFQCDGKSVAASDPPRACVSKRVVVVTITYVAKLASTDRMQAVAALATSLGVGVVDDAVTLTNATPNPQTRQRTAGCVAGTFVGSLNGKHLLGGSNPAADAAAFPGKVTTFYPSTRAEDVSYGITHHTVGQCLKHYFPGAQ